MIRDEVLAFVRRGPMPSEDDDSLPDEEFEETERLLHAITKPVTTEEAQLLLGCFGKDNCFGMAWTLVHLIETAPTPPVVTADQVEANPIVRRLWQWYRNL